MPSISTRPAIGSSSVAITRIVVVLPAPFGPMKPKISPGPTSKLTSREHVHRAEAVPEVAHADRRCAGRARSRSAPLDLRPPQPTTRTSTRSISTRRPESPCALRRRRSGRAAPARRPTTNPTLGARLDGPHAAPRPGGGFVELFANAVAAEPVNARPWPRRASRRHASRQVLAPALATTACAVADAPEEDRALAGSLSTRR